MPQVGCIGRAGRPACRGEAAAAVAARWQRDGVGYWVVTGRADPGVLGFCGVRPMRLAEAPALNLYYRLDPAAWGRRRGDRGGDCRHRVGHLRPPRPHR